ncbi:MAG TPA: hypothetical protein VE010_19830 [Thermoanaerobaculia bacterium]|nr:hypothetical protein [Thermoanaerobaculia bacterium]
MSSAPACASGRMIVHKRILGGLAVLGFVLSLAVHVSTFAGHSPLDRVPALWLLHIGTFVVAGPAILLVAGAARQKRLRAFVAPYPKAVIAAVIAVHVCASVAGLTAFRSLEGVAEERPSGYALVNRGELIREISRDEFLRARALDSRAFSAVWLSFYGVSALFWLFRRPQAEDS